MASAVATYGYIHAKLRTRIGLILHNPIINTVIDAPSIEDAMRALENSNFAPLAASWQESGNIRMGELALLSQEVVLLQAIGQQLPVQLKPFMKALLRQYEIQQVKEIIRHWFHMHQEGKDYQESAGYLFRDRVIHQFAIEAIMESDTFASMAGLFPLEYARLIQKEQSRIEADRSLYSLEREFDIYYYKQLLDAAKGLPFSDKTLAERHIYQEIDLMNIDTLYRSVKRYNHSPQSVVEKMIPFGKLYRKREELMVADTTEALAEFFTTALPYFQGNITKSLENDTLIEEYMLQRVPKDLAGNPFSLAIILCYVQLKRWENKRMLAIIHAKYYGLSGAAIRERL